MKRKLIIRHIFIVLIGIVFCFPAQAQEETKKNMTRMKVNYFKIMNQSSYLDIKITSKVDKQTIGVSNADIVIYNVFNDEKVKLGQTSTNEDGGCKFSIKNFNELQADSSKLYNLSIVFKGNDAFKKSKKDISFKDADIIAELKAIDSVNYISATLIDKGIDSVLPNQNLTVQVQRLFKPLKIGEEFNKTDENGTVIVPIETGIPGVDGKLNIEVVLSDSEDFGTVKAIVNAPVGVPIIEESTFNERTMWSPRNKTPRFLLIFGNLLMLGIWGFIIYLITNLFKITKTES